MVDYLDVAFEGGCKVSDDDHERRVESMMENKCDHEWEMSNFVIDTFPETYTYWCKKCKLVTHDTESAVPCPIKHFGLPW